MARAGRRRLKGVNIRDFRASVDSLVCGAPADALPAAIGEFARGKATLEARNRTPGSSTNGRKRPPELEQHYTAAQIAKLLTVKKSWVYAHRGELGGIKLSNGCVRYPASKIMRRLQAVARQG